MSTVEDLKARLQAANVNDAVTVVVGTGAPLTLRAQDLANALGVETRIETVRVRVTAPSGIFLRATAGRSGNRLASAALNELLDWFPNAPSVNADGETWIMVRQTPAPDRTTLISGFVAQRYTERVSVEILPIINSTSHKIGLHILQGGIGGQAILNIAKRLSAIGKPLACATVVNNKELANGLASVVPYVLFRDIPGDGNPDNPAYPADFTDQFGFDWMAQRWNRFRDLDPRVYIQPANEHIWHPKDGIFWQGVMRFLEGQGRKAAIFADAVGNPTDDGGITRLQKWGARVDALRRAMANRHVVALHVYSAPNTPAGQLTSEPLTQYFEFRYRGFYQSVPGDARPLLVISEAAREFSRGLFDGIPATIDWTRKFTAELRKDSYVIGACLWTAGNFGGWDASCIDSALPRLEETLNQGLA